MKTIHEQNQAVRQIVAHYGAELSRLSFEERRAACRYGSHSHVFPGDVDAVERWLVDEDNVAYREVDIGEDLPPFLVFGYHINGTIFVADDIRIRSSTLRH